MKTLTREQVERLASRKGVKRTAVENFLGTLGGSSREEALVNLELDARSYKWTAKTVKAINDGIDLADEVEGAGEG